MPGKDSPQERVGALAELLSERGVDYAVISDPRHVYYFTGFWTYKPRFSSFLLVEADGRGELFLGGSEAGRARSVFHGEVRTFEDYAVGKRMVSYPDFVSDELVRAVGGLAGAGPGARVGVEEWHLPEAYLGAARGKAAELVGLSREIYRMRLTKGKDEVAHLRAAAERVDFAYGVAQALIEPGRSEMEVYCEVNDKVIRRYGAHEFWEVPLVLGDFVSGERTLRRGGPPSEKALGRGETLILDLQAASGCYWSDTARTFPVGTPTREQAKVFEVVMEAKERAEAILRPGTKGRDVFEAIARVFTAAGFDPPSSHMGHGLGLEDQEPPFFLPNSDEALEEGMVCAVEPGVYRMPGGVRLEDDYLITGDGFERLSSFPLDRGWRG